MEKRTVMSLEFPRGIQNPFLDAQSPFPKPDHPIRASGPDLPAHDLDAEPLVGMRAPPAQPGQLLARAADIPHGDAVAAPLRHAQVPAVAAPDHLRDARPLRLSPRRQLERPHGTPPPAPVVQPHPSPERAGGQVPFAAHAERADDALDVAHAAAREPAPPSAGAHALDGPAAVAAAAVEVEDGDEVRGAGEEGVGVVGGEEEGVWRREGFRGGGDEGVGCDDCRGEEGRVESDREGAQGGEVQGRGWVLERVRRVEGRGVDGFRVRLGGVGRQVEGAGGGRKQVGRPALAVLVSGSGWI